MFSTSENGGRISYSPAEFVNGANQSGAPPTVSNAPASSAAVPGPLPTIIHIVSSPGPDQIMNLTKRPVNVIEQIEQIKLSQESVPSPTIDAKSKETSGVEEVLLNMVKGQGATSVLIKLSTTLLAMEGRLARLETEMHQNDRQLEAQFVLCRNDFHSLSQEFLAYAWDKNMQVARTENNDHRDQKPKLSNESVPVENELSISKKEYQSSSDSIIYNDNSSGFVEEVRPIVQGMANMV